MLKRLVHSTLHSNLIRNDTMLRDVGQEMAAQHLQTSLKADDTDELR
jgi:hypothetical protein